MGDELWTGYLLVWFIAGRPAGGFAAPVRLDPSDGTVLGRETAIATSPAVDAREVIVDVRVNTSAPQRQLVVRDKETLATLWTATLPGTLSDGPAGAAPAVVDGQIFVADVRSVSAYPIAGCGAATCDPTWTDDLGDDLTTVVAARRDNLVFTVDGTDLVALSRSTGAVVWTAPLGSTAPGLAITSLAGTVYVGAGNTLQAFPADGCGAAPCTPTWTATLAGNATTSPVVGGGVLYVGGDGAVEAFPAEGCGAATCPALASVPVSGTEQHLSVAGARLFVVSGPVDGASRLTAFTPTT